MRPARYAGAVGAAWQRGVCACGLTFGVGLGGCALAVDWDALRRGRPVQDADVTTDSRAPLALDEGAGDTLLPTPDSAAGPVDAGAADTKVAAEAAPDSATTVSSDTGCGLDPSVSCGPSQLGVSCGAGGQPAAGYSPCVLATATDTFCCTGNYCSFSGLPIDPAPCQQCYDQSCGALFCGCIADTAAGDTDTSGYPLCMDYVQCQAACTEPTLAACDSDCAPAANGNAHALAEGMAIENCVEAYCAAECN
jgi:hypothetical protein